MTGGFDGWLGATPLGPNASAIVTQIVAGPGITVSPPNGVGVVTISLTGAPYTLASLYNFGLTDSDADNTFVGGTGFGQTFFNDDGHIEIFSTGGFPLAITRQSVAQAVSVDVVTWRAKYPIDNQSSSIEQIFSAVGPTDLVQSYGTHQTNLAQAIAGTEGYYTPPLPFTYSGSLSAERWFLLNRIGFGNTTQVYRSSDGIFYRDCLLPPADGPFVIDAEQMSMKPISSSGSAVAQTGSVLRTIIKSKASGAGDGELLGGWSVTLLGESHGRFDIWAGTLAGGIQKAMEVTPPGGGDLSSAGTFAQSYIAARANLSNNGGAYSPIATFADLGPVTTPLITQDIVSASQTFKAPTTTFTVVPTVARRFLPIAAYVEFTTITALATGPSLKLGNNVAHDNVSPVLAVANTAVTDDIPPFVMAATPVVIDLTTNPITCEVTVNAAGTTCTGRVHVIGVYIT